jgi:hypothetical protein
MKVLGVISAAAMASAAVAASVLIVRSVPDIKRYLRIRAM